ncbi:OLC1v1012958C1 [Oldenlandia corymbosa var. corymbosa]|nr:OLC1v1012958C1 [Oldenlandia corymbosa var. corymbosa]
MLLYSSMSAVPLKQFQISNSKVQTGFVLQRKISSNDQSFARIMNFRISLLNMPLQTSLRLRAGDKYSNLFGDSMDNFEWSDEEIVEMEEGELGSPWEAAIIYRRNAAVSHLEYCTTLERLGLGYISTNVSKSRSSELGLRVTNSVKDFPDGTPVLVSIDVMRKKKKELRLDGLVRSVISLRCNRCGEPAAKNIFSNFSLLLTEEPIEEPETIDMGTIFEEDKFRSFVSNGEDEDDDSEYVDDQLYFPPGDKEIDISKPIRDLLHVEITIDTICDPKCKGICLRCGINLNTKSCKCKKQDGGENPFGPLGNLRKQAYQN